MKPPSRNERRKAREKKIRRSTSGAAWKADTLSRAQGRLVTGRRETSDDYRIAGVAPCRRSPIRG